MLMGAPTCSHQPAQTRSAPGGCSGRGADSGGNQFGPALSLKQSRCRVLKLCAAAEDAGQTAPEAHTQSQVQTTPEALPMASREAGISVLNNCIWKRLPHN